VGVGVGDSVGEAANVGITVGVADGVEACLVAATTVETASTLRVGVAAEGRLQAARNRPKASKDTKPKTGNRWLCRLPPVFKVEGGILSSIIA